MKDQGSSEVQWHTVIPQSRRTAHASHVCIVRLPASRSTLYPTRMLGLDVWMNILLSISSIYSKDAREKSLCAEMYLVSWGHWKATRKFRKTPSIYGYLQIDMYRCELLGLQNYGEFLSDGEDRGGISRACGSEEWKAEPHPYKESQKSLAFSCLQSKSKNTTSSKAYQRIFAEDPS